MTSCGCTINYSWTGRTARLCSHHRTVVDLLERRVKLLQESVKVKEFMIEQEKKRLKDTQAQIADLLRGGGDTPSLNISTDTTVYQYVNVTSTQ